VISPALLVVDDDDVFRERLLTAMADRGIPAVGAAGVEEALRQARRICPRRAVVDLRMPGGSGLDLVSALRRLQPDCSIVVLTGYGSIATAIQAIRLGASDYLSKPASVDQILEALELGARAEPETAADPTPTPSLDRVEWEHIQRVLADCGGNVSQAARALGMHRRSLQRKLARYAPRR
jgi:two-component system response regulator RegA